MHVVLVLKSGSLWGLASAACRLGRGPGVGTGNSWWQCQGRWCEYRSGNGKGRAFLIPCLPCGKWNGSWEKNLWGLVCRPGPCAPELFVCLCEVTQPVHSYSHVTLQSERFCWRFVTKVKVPCWTGALCWCCVLPNAWDSSECWSLPTPQLPTCVLAGSCTSC